MPSGRERKDSDYGIPSGAEEKSKIKKILDDAISGESAVAPDLQSAKMEPSQRETLSHAKDQPRVPIASEAPFSANNAGHLVLWLVAIVALSVSSFSLVRSFTETGSSQSLRQQLRDIQEKLNAAEQDLNRIKREDISNLREQIAHLTENIRRLEDRLQKAEKKAVSAEESSAKDKQRSSSPPDGS